MDERHAEIIEDIRNTVGHIERKQYEQDARISRVEGRVSAQEELTKEKYLRLDQKIDAVAASQNNIMNAVTEVSNTLTHHTDREDQDRGKLFYITLATLLSVIGYLGITVFERVMG